MAGKVLRDRPSSRAIACWTIYLTQSANLKLRPKIVSELRRGARVVSHNYHMGDWIADEVRRVRSEGGKRHTLYL